MNDEQFAALMARFDAQDARIAALEQRQVPVPPVITEPVPYVAPPVIVDAPPIPEVMPFTPPIPEPEGLTAAEVVAATDLPAPGLDPEDWTGLIKGPGPSAVVDLDLARTSPCIALESADGRRIAVYNFGIDGPLDADQEALYCQNGYEVRAVSEAEERRWKALSQAAPGCSVQAQAAGDASYEVFHSCLAEELRKLEMVP